MTATMLTIAKHATTTPIVTPTVLPGNTQRHTQHSIVQFLEKPTLLAFWTSAIKFRVLLPFHLVLSRRCSDTVVIPVPI